MHLGPPSLPQPVDDSAASAAPLDLSPLNQILKSRLASRFPMASTIQDLPRSVHGLFASVFCRVAEQALAEAPGAFEALLLLPQLLFPSSVRGKHTAHLIALRVSLFNAQRWPSLLEEPREHPHTPGFAFDKRKRATTLAKAGDFSAAMRALKPGALVAPDQALASLQALHPKADPPRTFPQPPNAQPFDPAVIPPIVRGLKRKKAADLFGWRAEHVRALPPEAISTLANLLLKVTTSPEIPLQEFRPFFFGARLVPISKKNGGIRPIAVGSLFRRLIATAIVRTHATEFKEFFQPLQHGIASPGGAENVVHIARALHSAHAPTQNVVSIDLTNAFNSVSRNAFLRKTDSLFPALNAWAAACYGAHSSLLLADGTIVESQCGVQQGDPLGPFFFCLAIHESLQKAAKAAEGASILAYMDDIYVLGLPAQTQTVVSSLSADLSEVGLRINLQKCWTLHRLQGELEGIPQTDPECVSILGAALSDNSPAPLLKESIGVVSKELPLLEDAQCAILMLRYIHNCSATFHLRTHAPLRSKRLVEELTTNTLSVLSKILDQDLSSESNKHARQRVFLPLGPGLGFTPLELAAPCAYKASLASALIRARRWGFFHRLA